MRIALTGGVSSGVSEAALWLQKKGIKVISADEIGHEILDYPDVKNSLVRRFGGAILDANGNVNRSNLGEIVFSDEAARADLNSIVHPVLLDKLAERVRQDEMESGVVVVDAALIYEWGMQGFFHRVVVVTAPMELRIQRCVQRDNLSREKVLQRISAQWPLEKKIEKADFVIENDGSIEDLHQRIEEVWGEIMEDRP